MIFIKNIKIIFIIKLKKYIVNAYVFNDIISKLNYKKSNI